MKISFNIIIFVSIIDRKMQRKICFSFIRWEPSLGRKSWKLLIQFLGTLRFLDTEQVSIRTKIKGKAYLLLAFIVKIYMPGQEYAEYIFDRVLRSGKIVRKNPLTVTKYKYQKLLTCLCISAPISCLNRNPEIFYKSIVSQNKKDKIYYLHSERHSQKIICTYVREQLFVHFQHQ